MEKTQINTPKYTVFKCKENIDNMGERNMLLS